MSGFSNSGRIDRLAPDALTDAQRAVHDEIAGGRRGGVRGPLAIWLRVPELARRVAAAGEHLRYGTALPPRLSELAILVTARAWTAQYEWYAHAPIALAAGLPQAHVDAIREGRAPSFGPDEAADAIVWRVATALHGERTLPEATYRDAVATLGVDTLIELIALCGYYTIVSMTLNAFDVALPEGEPVPLPPIA